MRRWVGILPLTQDAEKLTLEEMKQTVTNRLGGKDKIEKNVLTLMKQRGLIQPGLLAIKRVFFNVSGTIFGSENDKN